MKSLDNFRIIIYKIVIINLVAVNILVIFHFIFLNTKFMHFLGKNGGDAFGLSSDSILFRLRTNYFYV